MSQYQWLTRWCLLQLHNWYLGMLQNSNNLKSFNFVSNKAARVVRVLACLFSMHALWFESSTRPVSTLWVFQPRGNFINFHISNVLMQLLVLPTLWERYPNLCSQQAIVDKGVFLPVLEDMMARRPGKGYWMKAQSWQWMTVIFSQCLGLYAVGTKKRSDQIDFEATNIKQNIK